MRKIAVRVVTCVYAFMSYLSMPTFSRLVFIPTFQAIHLIKHFDSEKFENIRHFPDMDTKKKKKEKKKNVALKNNNDD